MGKRNRKRLREQVPAWDAVVQAAAAAFSLRDRSAYVDLLARLEAAPTLAVSTALGGALDDALGRLWCRGWQPADLPRVVRRKLSAAHVPVVARAVVAESRHYAAATVDARWAEQVADLDRTAPRGTAVSHGIEVLSLLLRLEPLPTLLSLPGEASSGSRRRSGIDGRLLERVRALLAKAESTTFPDEADSLTAKAQELMSRHSIDEAMVAASRGAGADMQGRRIGVDDPYAGAKSLLLARVADANRCRAVWCSDIGSSTVFGAEGDLDTVELLFTSLLRQATTAMMNDALVRHSRSTRSFRQSLLVAFAVRIGARLLEQDAATASAAAQTHGAGLLPVLAHRAAAADEACGATFPGLVRRGFVAHDAAGWAAGTAAAELADLGWRAAEVSSSALYY